MSYMVGKLAPKLTLFTRGLVEYVPPGGVIFEPSPTKTGEKLRNPPPPIVEHIHVLEGDKPVHHFPRFRPHIFFGADRCS